MSHIIARTRGGTPWVPHFLEAIDWDTCLGCGRCLTACGRGVMALVALDEQDQLADADDDDAVDRRVMALVDGAACIGCQACQHVCPKGCHFFAPALMPTPQVA